MDAKNSFVLFVLLLLSLGLFGSLSLTYCVWNKQAEVTRELADLQNELLRKLPGELLAKGQLKRNVRQADEDTDMPSAMEIRNALTEINEMKQILAAHMDCNKNEFNHTKCTLKLGPKGEPGDTGPHGKPGPPGTDGIAGPAGPKGDTGLQGLEGPPAEKGTKGELGDLGQKGEPGSKGMKGNVGYTGFKGEKGKEGVVGSPGPPGPEGGVQGKNGSKGEQGVVGAKGDMGERGLKGDMGPPGPRGETGEKGDIGQKGKAGTKGVKGIQGYPGYKGEKGQQSVAGPQGPPGSPGLPGPPGLPATAPTTAPITAPTIAPTTVTPAQCGGPGWRRVVFLNMTNTSHVCPSGLKLTSYSRRTCGRASSGGQSCSSTTFSVGDSQYSRVCGRALAYRWGQNYAFFGYWHSHYGPDGQYVDGLSLTHGASGSRHHIWTFASGLFTGSHSSSHPILRCPCDNGDTIPSPPFVGNDYFCESTRPEGTWSGNRRFYPYALLWDGQVCEGGGTCCQFNNPPWFTKNLTSPTTDSIELRLCLFDPSSKSDVALEVLELYVQ